MKARQKERKNERKKERKREERYEIELVHRCFSHSYFSYIDKLNLS